jgi:hypothetical protein
MVTLTTETILDAGVRRGPADYMVMALLRLACDCLRLTEGLLGELI